MSNGFFAEFGKTVVLSEPLERAVVECWGLLERKLGAEVSIGVSIY